MRQPRPAPHRAHLQARQANGKVNAVVCRLEHVVRHAAGSDHAEVLAGRGEHRRYGRRWGKRDRLHATGMAAVQAQVFQRLQIA